MSASSIAAVLLVLFLPGGSLGCCMKVNVSSKQFRDEQGRSRLFQGLNVVRACMHTSGCAVLMCRVAAISFHATTHTPLGNAT